MTERQAYTDPPNTHHYPRPIPFTDWTVLTATDFEGNQHWFHVPSAALPESADKGLRDGIERPEIVCLCGSTRFYGDFQQANYDLTMAGRIVLSVGFYPHAKAEHGHGEGVGHDSAEKVALDELHKRKIDLADWVYVLNRDGYIGDSTRSEIDYALAHGKPVRYAFDTDGVGSLLGWDRPDHADTNAALRAALAATLPEPGEGS